MERGTIRVWGFIFLFFVSQCSLYFLESGEYPYASVLAFFWTVCFIRFRFDCNILLLQIAFLAVSMMFNTYGTSKEIYDNLLKHPVVSEQLVNLDKVSGVTEKGVYYDGIMKPFGTIRVFVNLDGLIHSHSVILVKTGGWQEAFSNSYKNYLLSHGYVGQITLSGYDPVFCEAHLSTLDNFKYYAGSLFANITGEGAQLLRAMIFGDKAGLDYDKKQLFQTLGISHILVASGQNLAYIYFIVNSLFFFAGRNIRSALTISLCLLFAVLVGDEASIWRAFVVVVLLEGAKLSGRQARGIYLLGVTALFLNVFMPFSLFFDIGFQLSFGAFFGIILVSQLLDDFAFMKHNMLLKILLPIFAAQIFTLPFQAYYFGIFNSMSIFANIFVAVFLPLLLVLGLIAAIIPADISIRIFDACYSWFIQTLHILASGNLQASYEVGAPIFIFMLALIYIPAGLAAYKKKIA